MCTLIINAEATSKRMRVWCPVLRNHRQSAQWGEVYACVVYEEEFDSRWREETVWIDNQSNVFLKCREDARLAGT